MSTIYDTITINGTEFPRPVKFTPERQDIYAGEGETFDGSKYCDLVGWKYDDMTLEWAGLPQSKVSALVALSGSFPITFDDADGSFRTETARRISIVSMRHARIIGGESYYRNVSVKISFMTSHSI